jgi:hypothetical protein
MDQTPEVSFLIELLEVGTKSLSHSSFFVGMGTNFRILLTRKQRNDMIRAKGGKYHAFFT